MLVVGRYAIFEELARGGMAAVYLGRLLGPAGFSRTVAIKRLHPHLATDPSFVAMLLDEARLAGRIQHPNVAATLDVVAEDGELFVVMEYLHGETLSRLSRIAKSRGETVPATIAVGIVAASLHGLHAAHEVQGENGEPLGIVHRDVSPQNIMVRRDGSTAVVDFGVAKAAGRYQTTEDGQVKGKLPYMAPEQVRGGAMTRRVDVYAAFAVLWETLVGRRLFVGDNDGEVLEQLLFGTVAAPGTLVPGLPPALDEVVMRGLSRDPEKRFATAREAALALEEALPPPLGSRVSAWIESLVGKTLDERASRVAAMESSTLHEVADVQALMSRPGRAAAEIPVPPPSSNEDALTAGSFAAPTKPGRARKSVLVAVGASVVAASAIVALLLRGAPTASAPVAALAEPSPSASVPAPPSPPTTSATPVVETAAPPAPSASTPPPGKTASPPPKPAKPRADCSVPYTLDGNGRKTYKRECL